MTCWSGKNGEKRGGREGGWERGRDGGSERIGRVDRERTWDETKRGNETTSPVDRVYIPQYTDLDT